MDSCWHSLRRTYRTSRFSARMSSCWDSTWKNCRLFTANSRRSSALHQISTQHFDTVSYRIWAMSSLWNIPPHQLGMQRIQLDFYQVRRWMNHLSDESSPLLLFIVSDKPYPYEITDLHVREEFGSIWVRWNDSHQVEAPVEFVLVCNSRTNVELRLGRDTAYVCQQMTFKLTDSITVYTRVAIPGYTHPRSPSVSVDGILSKARWRFRSMQVLLSVRPVSDLPEITVSSRTENSITIKWDYASMAAVSNSAMYHIQCDTNQAQILINIQSNEYQCTSLSSGTLHIISMKVSNAESTAERVKSIQTNTCKRIDLSDGSSIHFPLSSFLVLAKSKYNTHFYPSDTNRVRSVIIEWTPPQGDIETVQVICPSSSVTFERNQLMPTMFVKCSVTSGEPYRVIFLTTKSGYETATFEFTDTAPSKTGSHTHKKCICLSLQLIPLRQYQHQQHHQQRQERLQRQQRRDRIHHRKQQRQRQRYHQVQLGQPPPQQQQHNPGQQSALVRLAAWTKMIKSVDGRSSLLLG